MKRLPPKIKLVCFTLTMLILAATVGWVFWDQELKYALPTPVPVNFVNVNAGTKIDLRPDITPREAHYTILHFFNPDCPCSRFNMEEFESLAHKYKDKIDFFVIIQSDDNQALEQFQRKYALDIPVVLDKTGELSDKCGVYSTPQAVILDRSSALYFKGNYNKARYCTNKETKFVEMAITFLLKNEPLPLFMQYAIGEPYGCSLPSDQIESKSTALF